jgi:hypothetical protein
MRILQLSQLDITTVDIIMPPLNIKNVLDSFGIPPREYRKAMFVLLLDKPLYDHTVFDNNGLSVDH